MVLRLIEYVKVLSSNRSWLHFKSIISSRRTDNNYSREFTHLQQITSNCNSICPQPNHKPQEIVYGVLKHELF